MKKNLILSLFALLGTALTASAQPRLIVQIVVGSMRASDLERYAANFGEGGFRRLMEGGTHYTDARYNYMQTTTPVGMATLATGAMPSTHGVIGTSWVDYTTNRVVQLLDGRRGTGGYHLFAPTLAETLREHDAESRTVTVAGDALSAVMLAGQHPEAFWMEGERCDWMTSPYYAQLPEWVLRMNRERYNLSYISMWRTSLDPERYLNSRHWDIVLPAKKRGKAEVGKGRFLASNDLERLRYTPAGNSAVLGFAKQVIAKFGLGSDATPDLLNISLDAARYITELYGPESIEAEDMLYALDRDLDDFLTYLFAQVDEREVVVVLTSDHGTSASYDLTAELRDRFNVRQFEVIVNSFLNVRYGSGDWVVGYADRTLWLNHNLIYERGLDLGAVQNEVAVFAMQFEGVAHALTSTAMRSSYFGEGYGRRMQNSFFPRRSGDVVLNLMPGWIEERDGSWSQSGSMYGYDTEVPLIFYGAGITAQRIDRRVDMTAVAPTLARLAGTEEPTASEEEPLKELVN